MTISTSAEHFYLVNYHTDFSKEISGELAGLMSTRIIGSMAEFEQQNHKNITAFGYVIDKITDNHLYNLQFVFNLVNAPLSYIFTEQVSIPLLRQAIRLQATDVVLLPCTKQGLIEVVSKVEAKTAIPCYAKKHYIDDSVIPIEDIVSHPLLSLFELIEQNYAMSPSLKSASKQLHLSPSRISHLFKDLCGIGFSQYVICRRIEQAELLLSQPNPSVTAVGFELGFSNPSHFCRCFKEHTGLTPSAFINSKDGMKISNLYKRYQMLRLNTLPQAIDSFTFSAKPKCLNA
jgi:AraC-like DNA-binding protein